METLNKMPTRTRKYYIQLHNGEMEKKNAARKKHNSTNTNINTFAQLEQANMRNAQNRS